MIIDGPEIDIGAEDKFFSVCFEHYEHWDGVLPEESDSKKCKREMDIADEKETTPANKKPRIFKYCNRGIQGNRRGCWTKVEPGVAYCDACAKEMQQKEQQKSDSASPI